MRRFGLAAAAVLLFGAALGLSMPSAHAAAYRYWSYWHANPGSSSWTFAGTGPTYRPSPGAVEGWRFAVSPGTADAPMPRSKPTAAYAEACKGVTAPSGDKLIALVVDYGTTADEPSGESPPSPALVATCVHVPSNGTGLDVLRAAGVSVRQQNGLVCGLNGYPKTECAVLVTSSPTPKPSATPSKSTSSAAPSKSKMSSPSATHPASPSPTPTHASAAHSSAKPTPSRSPSASARATPTPSGTPLADPATSSAAAVSSSAAADASPSLVVGDVASSSGHGTPWPLLGGGLVVLALVGGTALRLRGRR